MTHMVMGPAVGAILGDLGADVTVSYTHLRAHETLRSRRSRRVG